MSDVNILAAMFGITPGKVLFVSTNTDAIICKFAAILSRDSSIETTEGKR